MTPIKTERLIGWILIATTMALATPVLTLTLTASATVKTRMTTETVLLILTR